MNKKIMITTLGLSAMIAFANAQEVTTTSAQTGDVDPNGTTSTCISLANDLRLKMKDANSDGDVNTLQDFLITNNYMTGQPTGYFGLATLKAVKLFQQRQGLNATGFVGPLTRAKIGTASCSLETTMPLNPTAMPPQDQGATQGKSTSQWDTLKNKAMNMLNRPDQKGDTKGGQMSSLGQNMMQMGLSTFLSDADKQTLKDKEDAVKKLRTEAEDYYKSSRPTDTTQMSDTVKAELKTKMDAVMSAQKDLDETRKAIFDKLKTTLTDEQKKKLESMMPRQGGASSTMMRRDDMKKMPMRQGENEGREGNGDRKAPPCDTTNCDNFGGKREGTEGQGMMPRQGGDDMRKGLIPENHISQ